MSEQRVRDLLEERECLSRNLHDHVVQALYAIGLELDALRRKSSPDIAPGLARIVESLNRVMRDARRYIAGAPPPALSGQQFRAELGKLLNKPASAPRFRLNISTRAVDSLGPDAAEHLLHIAREALSNALRHSHARAGCVALQATRTTVVLEVKDDGSGFDPQKVERESGGLRNIATRARQIGATLELLSSPGGGTSITVNVPKRETSHRIAVNDEGCNANR